MKISTLAIIGGSGDIGRAVGIRFGSSTRRVLATYKSQLPREIMPDWMSFKHCDASNTTSIRALLSQHAPIDYLLYAAGIARPFSPPMYEVSDILEEVSVNLTGAVCAAYAVVESMIIGGFGRILFLGSVVGDQGSVGLAGYSASKSGLLGLTKSLNRDIRLIKSRLNQEADVTVNLVTPGYVESSMTQQVPPRVRERICKNTTTGRFVTTTEVVDLIDFLFSSKSSSISGVQIEITGGLNL